MKKLSIKKNAAAFAVACILGMTANPAMSTGIPTIDVANLMPNMLTYIENTLSTVEQTIQSVTQLTMLETYLKNTIGPIVNIWDRANNIVARVNGLESRLRNAISNMGNLNAYLDKYTDLNFYRTSCAAKGRCSDADLLRMAEQLGKASADLTEAYKGLTTYIDDQEKAMNDDAKEIGNIAKNAGQSQGQMQALQNINMLLANLSTQMLEARRNQLALLQHQLDQKKYEKDLDDRNQAKYEGLYRVPSKPIKSDPMGKWTL
jgi:P-type conjugative transfer protein TrbJ